MRGLTYTRRIRISENIHYAVTVAYAPRIMAGRVTARADSDQLGSSRGRTDG